MAEVREGSWTATSNMETPEALKQALSTNGDGPASPTPPEPAPSEPVAPGPSRDERGRFTKQETPDVPATPVTPPVSLPDEQPPADPEIDVETGLRIKSRPYELVRRYQERWEKAQQELQALRQGGQQVPPSAVPQPPPAPQPPPPTRAEPSEDEIGTKYQSYGEFVRDHGMWVREQIVADTERRENALREQWQQQQRGYQQQQAQHAIAEAGRQAYPDFDTVVGAAVQSGLTLSPHLSEILLSLPDAHAVIYQLAKNPQEARRLSGLSHPVALAVEVGKLSALAQGEHGAPPPVIPQKRANPPISPVGGSAAQPDEPPGDSTSAAEHARYWNKRLKVPGARF